MCATKSTNSCYVSSMWVVIHFDDSFDSFASSPLLYVTNIFLSLGLVFICDYFKVTEGNTSSCVYQTGEMPYACGM